MSMCIGSLPTTHMQLLTWRRALSRAAEAACLPRLRLNSPVLLAHSFSRGPPAKKSVLLVSATTVMPCSQQMRKT